MHIRLSEACALWARRQMGKTPGYEMASPPRPHSTPVGSNPQRFRNGRIEKVKNHEWTPMDTNRERIENHRWTRINTDVLGWVVQGIARNITCENRFKAVNAPANHTHHYRKHLTNLCKSASSAVFSPSNIPFFGAHIFEAMRESGYLHFRMRGVYCPGGHLKAIYEG